MSCELFAVPIMDNFLLYAPLQGLAALMNGRALAQARTAFENPAALPNEVLRPFVRELHSAGPGAPSVRTGPVDDPFLLGLIPTRGCDLACRYCDFAAPKSTHPAMDCSTARAAVDAYFQLLVEARRTRAEIHFFGGEPFSAPEVVQSAVGHATGRAAELGLATHFEATTNGFYGPDLARWIARHLDAVVVSLDGPAEVQDRQRPARRGQGSFETVARNARLFSEGPVELLLRACVTADTVERIPEIARWMASEFRPSTVCFEGLTRSPLSEAAGLRPPNPWVFAQSFLAAAGILEGEGIAAVLSTADLRTCQASCCPVGKDALIVSPDGAVDACYQLPQAWWAAGLDMRLGRLDVAAARFILDGEAVERVRGYTVHRKRLCAACLCRWHCAGGCHLTHDASAPPGQYDSLCLLTRLVTVGLLLRRLGQHALLAVWLADRAALGAAARQTNDRLLADQES